MQSSDKHNIAQSPNPQAGSRHIIATTTNTHDTDKQNYRLTPEIECMPSISLLLCVFLCVSVKTSLMQTQTDTHTRTHTSSHISACLWVHVSCMRTKHSAQSTTAATTTMATASNTLAVRRLRAIETIPNHTFCAYQISSSLN